MKKIVYLSIMLFSVVLISCQKETKSPGNPILENTSTFSSAYFGDSIPFSANVSDADVPLSTLKAQLFFGEELVSETVIRTKENGSYAGKLFIPFLKNIPNGTATLKLLLQNINFTIVEQSYELPLSRPDFPSLTFVTEAGDELIMNRVGQYQYSVTDNFDQRVKGYLIAPAYGVNGNDILFGWEDGAITQGTNTLITFSNATAGTYDVTFNTQTYVGSPFLSLKINDTDLTMIDENNYSVDLSLTRDAAISVEGIDLDNFWIDPDFLRYESGVLYFNALSGSYRITANFVHNYFIVEALSGSGYASLNTDGSGAIWAIGDNIGKPSVAGNAVGWTTEKGLCLAPIGNKQYRLTLVADQTVTANSINFKFFHQKGWGGEFKAETLSCTSDVVFVGDGTNGRDSGNLGIITGQSLEVGATYEFVVDLSGGNSAGILTVTKL